MTTLGSISRKLFGIPSEQSVFQRPGFAPQAWDRFAPVAHGLVEGYHATLEDSRIEVLVPRLNRIPAALQGFAYEGVGMALAALDCIAPWKDRLNTFVAGPGARHIYPMYVGVGLALARLRRNPERFLPRLDPVLNWVIVDGYGFHEAFFSYHRTVSEQRVPRQLSAYARRLFDQGVGRGIWFASGAQVDRVAGIIAAFPAARQADLWSGVGLACSYAGGVSEQEIGALLSAAEPFHPQLARGAGVAAMGRHQAGNIVPHTELACRVFCSCSSEDAARVTDSARQNLPQVPGTPAHELWRQRTVAQLARTDDLVAAAVGGKR